MCIHFRREFIMNKKYLLLAGASLVLAAGIISCTSAQKNPDRHVAGGFFGSIEDIVQRNRENYAQLFGEKAIARELKSSEILKYASSGNIPLKGAELIIDNDAAFDAKIKTIRAAKETLRLGYFIYADDDSSAVFTQEIINKAKTGTKVKLIVDFITNYKNMDLFKYMTKEGNGNIDVRFYNFPSARLQADARYMTLPCPKDTKPASDTCKNFKSEYLKSITAGNDNTFFSKLFLAGLYGKNPTALKIALGMGAQIDPANYKSDKKMSEDDQAQLLEFFKLYYKAKVQKSITAKISLMIAMQMHADELNPIVNEITGRLPTIDESSSGGATSHAQEWDHFTDYTHHKIIIADGNEFVLGGRNVEDSYHMKTHLGDKGKYIFMDTDFHGIAQDGKAADIASSFDKTFNFRAMVAPLSEVEKVMPIDLVMNDEALGESLQNCMTLVKTGKLDPMKSDMCIADNLKNSSKFQSTAKRLVAFKQEFTNSFNRYNFDYAKANPSKKMYADHWKASDRYTESINKLSKNDTDSAEVYYVENTSYNVKESNPSQIVRRVGSRIGAEEVFNKNIHKLWYKSLENSCYISHAKKEDVRVIFHSAYLYLPSGLVHKITKMMNGDYGDCSKVHITFLTNSFETTDLNVVNVFARYQLSQIFKHYQSLTMAANGYRSWVPKMDYYEYKAATAGAGVSLHTKTSLFGNDIMIGSANADVRSYAMDTNNAVFIRGAKDLTREYGAFVDRIIADNKRTQPMGEIFANMTGDQIKLENQYILGAMICRWDKSAKNCPAQPGGMIKASEIKSEKFKAERIADILATIDQVGADISNKTKSILNFRGEFDMAETYQYSTGSIEMKLNELSNEFDDFYKVL